MAIREARRPSEGVEGEDRETWCHTLAYARRVWRRMTMVSKDDGGDSMRRIPCQCSATLLCLFCHLSIRDPHRSYLQGRVSAIMTPNSDHLMLLEGKVRSPNVRCDFKVCLKNRRQG